MNILSLENARRIHRDAAILFNNKSYRSCIFFCVIAIEECAKAASGKLGYRLLNERDHKEKQNIGIKILENKMLTIIANKILKKRGLILKPENRLTDREKAYVESLPDRKQDDLDRVQGAWAQFRNIIMENHILGDVVSMSQTGYLNEMKMHSLYGVGDFRYDETPIEFGIETCIFLLSLSEDIIIEVGEIIG